MHRTEDEINEQINRAQEHTDEGVAAWPGMSYEQGVANALNWAIGDSEDAPMEEDD